MRKACLVMAICSICVAWTFPPALSSPDTQELESFRILVPDFSKTSGGNSPALSPDGKTLAFLSSNGDVYILHGLDKSQGSPPQPWKLEFKPAGPRITERANDPESQGGDTREVDWSPDGKHLAFGYPDGRLYIAGDFDFANKTAEVKAVGSTPSAAGPVGDFVRWSPDGTRVAFARYPNGPNATLCVINVRQGEETVIAKDAARVDSVSLQPWSPDGKRLVYTGWVLKDKRGIFLVSVDGKERVGIASDAPSYCPSWSPNSEQIAMERLKSTGFHYPSGSTAYSTEGSGVWITDSHGVPPKPAPPTLTFSKEQLAAAEKEGNRLAGEAFEKMYGDALTPEQKKQLQQGEMTDHEMNMIAYLAEARKIGGDLPKRVEEILATQKGDEAESSAITAIMDKLTDKQQNQIFDRVAGFGFQSLQPLVRTIQDSGFGFDSQPVWSPNGKSLAFVRSRDDGQQVLYVLDIATGSSRQLFTSGAISCVSWSHNGKSILLESNRLVSLKPERSIQGTDQAMPGDEELKTTLGYPEVWLLTLRQRGLTPQ
jgi:Tol biopolymer transport system component